MTNIVTRKGLAFGALVALASTAIAGAPASAAGELNVVPSAGTSYNAVEGTAFNLKTTFAPGFTPSSYAQLKYQIKTDANSTVAYDLGTAAVTAPATSVAVSTTVVTAATAGASATSVNYLGLKSTTASATTSVEVTAFVDANNDSALSAGEWNTVKTVTFKKFADIVPVVTVGAANQGDASISASVAWGDLNVEQASNGGVFEPAAGSANSSLGIEFSYDGAAYPTTWAAATAPTYSSSTGKFTTTQAVAAGKVVAARAVWATNTYAATTNTYGTAVVLGSAASVTSSTNTISSVTANSVKGADAIATSATTGAASTTARVRTNGSWTASVKALDTASTPVAKAGVAVVATVATNATLSATAGSVVSVTVNGTVYTSGTTLAALSIPLTTDASGLATVAISSAGMTAANTITVSFTAQNLTSAVVGDFEDATYTVSDDAAAAIVATSKNAAASFNYSVKDQFDVLSARTNERLVVTATAASGTSPATQYIAVSGGKATFSVTPTTDNTAAITVAAALEVSTNTNGSISWAANGANVANRTLNVRSAAYSFTTAPATAQVAGVAYNATSNYKQTITQVVQSDTAATGYVAPASNTTYAKISLVGSNAGEALTVSGTGVYLSIDGAAVAADKATKIAQATAVDVYVASNTVGTKTITFSNGTVSATVDVVFVSAASAESTATNFAVAVVAAAQSGRAIDATVTVTDKWGNPVADFDATATVSGVALVNGAASANVTTDANGKATVKLSAGVNDLGDAVVTFSDRDSNTSTDVTAVAKTVTFGMTDGFIDVLNGKRASVTWSFAKGKRAAFYLDGVRKYNLVQPGDAEMNLQFNLKKGTHTIKLVIGGVTVDSITVKISK